MSATSARAQILSAVREARPPSADAPDIGAAIAEFDVPARDLVAPFIEAVVASGGQVLQGARGELRRLCGEATPGATRIVSVVPGVAGTVTIPENGSLLADLDVFVCEAAMGVAENGAAWLSMSHAGERAALFLAAHVIVVLERRAIVAHLHAAYAQIDLSAQSFGVLVAGPSKTADIEQSLVIGAQGPMQLTVLLVDDGRTDGAIY